MTGKQIFMQRLIQEWHFQYGVIRTVLDWTVVLYLVAPAIITLTYLYIDAWNNIYIYWNQNIPFSIVVAIILLLSSGGNFRTYLLEADLLYLIQRKKILYQLKKCGLLISLFQSFLRTTLILMAALPILIQIYQFSLKEILFLWLAVSSFKLSVLTLKKIFNRHLYKRVLISSIFLVTIFMILNIPSIIYGIVGAILIIIMVIYHSKQIMRTNRWFLKELSIENIERYRYIKFIMNFSEEVETETISTRKRPYFLFRTSNRIFKMRNKENGVLELQLKAFLRNKKYVLSYVQLIGVTCFAITVLPFWFKWVVYICFVLFVSSWIKSIYGKMLKDSFFTVVPVDKEISDIVRFRFKRWLCIPPGVFIGLFIILLTLSRW